MVLPFPAPLKAVFPPTIRRRTPAGAKRHNSLNLRILVCRDECVDEAAWLRFSEHTTLPCDSNGNCYSPITPAGHSADCTHEI
jgi:hypothetical protein